MLGGSLLLLGGAIVVFSARFGDHAIAASGVAASGARQAQRAGFRRASPARVLRQKEWTLLLRDPWLVSQTLMQLLYLLPPALLLWRSYGEGTGALVVLVPVLVMAAGQLAGGLAWLAISGEDAPDLVATAPVLPSQIVRAKIEAVLGGITIAFAPFIAALTFLSVHGALIAALGVLASAAAATGIQFFFRKQATRRYFRHRQTASRFATFAEAFSSISWAAAAALAVGGTWFALFPAAIGFGDPRRRALDEPASGLTTKMAGLSPGHCTSFASRDHRVTPLSRGGPVMIRFADQLPAPLMISPNSSQRSPVNFCICICLIG